MMRPRHLTLVLIIAVTAWLVADAAYAGSKLATLTVKGMVCQS
jgi:hypothetical protein